MTMAGHFRVTYDVVTPESAAEGDFAEAGWEAPEPVTLREALRTVGHHYRRGYGAGLEDCGRWFATVDPATDYGTGAETRYAIHPSATITPASYRRVSRILAGKRGGV